MLSTAAATPFMPWLLAFEAGMLAAMSTLELVTFTCLLDVFLAFEVRAPDHIWVQVNLAGQA